MFPSNKTITAKVAFEQLVGAASLVRTQAADLLTKSASPVSSSVILTYLGDLLSLYTHMQTLAATPGLPEYAQTQFNNPSYDIVAEYNAMTAQMVLMAQAISTAFPRDGSGWLQAQTMNANGVRTDRVFSAASLTAAGIPAQLTALVATVAA